MSVAYVVIGILGLAVLMVVHEGGHYLAARRFGMRVTKFSIGFGPTLWKHKPKGSPTTFQIAIIPFLAYVQIAGMNPYEESDPNDPESYANASLWGRITAIAAGPLANYFFASVLMFFGFVIGGNRVLDETMRVSVLPNGPAAQAGVVNGDRVLSVNGESVHDWQQLKRVVGGHAGEKLDIEIERGKERLHVGPTPSGEGPDKGKIMIGAFEEVVPVTVAQAAVLSVKEPPKVVWEVLKGLGRIITFKEKPEFIGPAGMARESAAAAKEGPDVFLKFLGAISAYLGAFNLLPFPALDGGRLLFLGIEAASRRRADAKVEAKVHAIGILMFLTLIAIISWNEIPRLFMKH